MENARDKDGESVEQMLEILWEEKEESGDFLVTSNLDGKSSKFHSALLTFVPFFQLQYNSNSLLKKDSSLHRTNLSMESFEWMIQSIFSAQPHALPIEQSMQLLDVKEGVSFYFLCPPKQAELCKPAQKIYNSLHASAQQIRQENCLDCLLFSLRNENEVFRKKCEQVLEANRNLFTEIGGYGVEERELLSSFFIQLLDRENRRMKKQIEADGKRFFEIGSLFEMGCGIEVDYVKAVEHYEIAAHKGDIDGMNALGWCLRHGIGTAKNIERAIELFKAASEKGSNKACNNLALIYEMEKKDLPKAIELYEVAVRSGNISSMFNLALLYMKGPPGVQNLARAQILLEEAASKGHIKSKLTLQSLK